MDDKINNEIKNIEKCMQYLANLSVEELKQAYLSHDIKWIYIAELKERKHISKEEMNYIVGYWK